MNSPGIGQKFIQGFRRCIVIGLALGLAACGGGDGDEDQGGAAGTQPAPSGIGAAGGTVQGPNGSKVVIPSGALAVVTQIAVEQTTAGAPPLPPGLTPIGQMFAFTPHGTTFAVPVTVTMPFDPASVPAGVTPALFKTNSQNQWEKVVNATFGASSVSGQVTSFSDFQAVTEAPDLSSSAVRRNYTFSNLVNSEKGALGGQNLIRGDVIVSIGTDLIDPHEFGPANFDSGFAFFDGTRLEKNEIANGIVTSARDGRTFQVATEAPLANANILGEVVGSETELIQRQAFIKEEEDATLSFTMPLVRIETHDDNISQGRPCEPNASCDFIRGELDLEVKAFTGNTEFFHVSGNASVNGFAQNWHPKAHSVIGSSVPFWSLDDFQFLVTSGPNTASGSQAVLTLREPQTFSVDLSSLNVGQAFQIRIKATAYAHNRLGGPPSERPTGAGAYINFEPFSASGAGSLFLTTGLGQADVPLDDPDPPPIPFPPLPCGSNPGAGVLQFSAATYTTPERDTPPTVTVTRTGGSSGRVSATFTTIGGTATADSDFEPVNVTVFFADGDSEPRVVEIPILQDSSAEPNETVELELSQPGGCVQLGPQSTAILTIVDDDAAALPSGLDGSFGDGGKAAFKDASGKPFGGDRSGMAVQPDGKVVMVGGTFTDFIMARFKADGTPDTDFGNGGKVTTHIVGSDPAAQQEANAVALQRDGKIVVAGSATLPRPDGRTAIALVRYNSNGSIDTSFNGNGFVFGPTLLFGRAHAVAIDSKDRIVVAGDTPKAGNTDFGDFIVARFKSTGEIDATFGQAGFNVTDVGGVTNEGHGLKVLAGDALLVSGFAPIFISNVNGTNIVSEPLGAVVRYQENGFVDQTFGAAGRVALPGDNVGRGLAVQSDGRIVLAGSIDVAILPATQNRFALMRLLADGRIDDSFGAGGRVQTAFVDRGDDAFGIAIQSDGKIVAAGRTNGQLNSNFAVARYDSKGDLDPSFSGDGKLTIDFFGSTDIAENVAIQSDGKIVLGGLARDSIDGYGVARVLP
jgi:uncharacterized delta-60 repeat protein